MAEKEVLRIKCQVLQELEACQPCTSITISQSLLHLSNEQIQKAIYRLLAQDRIYISGQERRSGSDGRPLNVYRVTENWEPRKEKREKKGRVNYTQSLAVSNEGLKHIAIKHRDRKIRLLRKLLDFCTTEADEQLLNGLILDLGGKYDDNADQ